MGVGIYTQQRQPQQQQQTVVKEDIISNKELKEKIDAMSKINEGILFERKRDGISINKSIYLDPEGEVVRYGADYSSGDFSYLIKTGPSTYIMKFSRALIDEEPITLANAEYSNSRWNVKTVTGKNLSGSGIIMMSQGFLVKRTGSAFMFEPGKRVKSVSAIDGYNLAKFQNGDVATTKVILQEKIKSETDQAQLLGTLSSIGNTLGMNKANDYVLVNMENGKQIPLDITTEDNKAGYYSNCRRRSALVNECDDVEFKSSLYDQRGSRNLGHYFWKIIWYKTDEGSFAIVQEGGTRKISIINLNTGMRVTAFERMLGIAGFSTNQDKNGKIQITAQMGFSEEKINDAVDFFNKNPKTI